MSRECLACLITHDATVETCASCGESQYPEAWFHITPVQWDPICSNCFDVMLTASAAGLRASVAAREAVIGE